MKTRNLVCFLAVLFSFSSVSPANMAIKNFQVVKEKDGIAGCWNVIPSPQPSFFPLLYAVTGSGNDVWAVGEYGDGTRAITLTMHWNGGAWSVVPSPNVGALSNSLFGVSGSGNDVWAAGYYYTFEQGFEVSRALILHWDGSAWSVVASPNPGFWGNNLYAVVGSTTMFGLLGITVMGSAGR